MTTPQRPSATGPQPGGRPARGRRPWLAPLVLLTLLLVPIVEVWLIVSVGNWIGALPTIGILVAGAFLGAWLMRREGSKAWRALNESVSSGRLPGGELLDPVLIVVGGILVMLPGFFTDIFGLIFLLPFTRPLARNLLQLFITRRAARAGINLDVMRARVDRQNLVEGESVPDAAASERPGATGGPGSQRQAREPGEQSRSPSDPTIIKGEIEP